MPQKLVFSTVNNKFSFQLFRSFFYLFISSTLLVTAITQMKHLRYLHHPLLNSCHFIMLMMLLLLYFLYFSFCILFFSIQFIVKKKNSNNYSGKNIYSRHYAISSEHFITLQFFYTHIFSFKVFTFEHI